jgi:NADH:ubiquinone oxidoreductase subunit E
MENQVTTDERTLDVINAVMQSHGTSRSELIPILKAVMDELGFISPTAVIELSARMRLPASEIQSVATFYRMLSTQRRGKHVIQFCESAPCHVVGGRQIMEALRNTLGIEPGQTSADNRWTFLTTSCLGVCGIGPVMLVDTDLYGNLQPEQIPCILSHYD